MEFEIVVILIKVILGILGGTPLMLLIKEVLRIKDFFIKSKHSFLSFTESKVRRKYSEFSPSTIVS